MKKSVKKAICAALAAAVGTGSALSLASCKKKDAIPDNETSIQISYWKSGLGIDWLNNLAEKFQADYPQYKVYIEPSSSVGVFTNTISLTKDNSIDMYLTTLASDAYYKYFEPLNDVLDYTWEGENKTIRQKIDPTILKAISASDGNNYSLSYGGGICSIAYNKDVLNGTDYEVPRTTDELYTLVMRLKTDKKTPFITFENGGYWFTLYDTWLAQYNGLDYYYNTLLRLEGFEGEEKDIEKGKAILFDEDKKTGRYQVLELLSKILADEYHLSGSAGAKFTAQQTKFIGGQGVMMPNGTWLYNEMKNSVSADKFNIGFMRVPVLSAITETLEQVKDDRALSSLIAAVDAANDVSEVPLSGDGYSATQKDVERVWEARHMMFSCIDEASCVIPNYSNAKEGAKLFFKYMYSDKMIHEYCQQIHMWFPAEPTDKAVDTSSWTAWEKDVYAIQRTSMQLTKYKVVSPIMQEAGVYAGYQPWTAFSAKNAKDRLSAEQFWTNMRDKYTENWPLYLHNAGYTTEG